MNRFKQIAQERKASRLVAVIECLYSGSSLPPAIEVEKIWTPDVWKKLAAAGGVNEPSAESRALVVAELRKREQMRRSA